MVVDPAAAEPSVVDAPHRSPRDDARALANEAANAFARGDFARARELCELAYQKIPAPTIALLEARSLVRLDRWLEAAAAYQRAAGSARPPGSPDTFERAARDADGERTALLERIPRLRLTLAKPAAARAPVVRLDGRVMPQSRLGEWMLADPRSYTIDVLVNGRVEHVATVALRARDARTLVVHEAPPRSDPLERWGYVAGGVGAVSLLVGALSASADAPSYRTLSRAGYAFGAGSLAFSAVVLVWPRPEEPARLRVSASLGHVSLEGAL